MANARLGWFSPLGVAASIRASARRVGLRAHCFRFSARTVSEIAAGRVGLRAHCFRFSARADSGLPSASWFFRSAGWPSGSLLPLFGTHRFGGALGGLVLPPSGLAAPSRASARRLAFGFTASAFRHAPLRSCHSASWPSGSRLPLFGMDRFGVAARRVGLRAHRFRFSACAASEIPARRIGLRAHCFRFSACADSEWPLGEFVLPPSASEIAVRRVGLRAHRFRFSARTASEWPLGGLAFGFTASAFRHAPLRSGCWASWPSGSRLPLFGTHRFGVALGGLAFGLTASAFRHAPIRGCPRRVGLRAHCFRFSACTDSGVPSADWPLGSRLPLFGMHRSAPPHRRSEDRRSTTTRHLFHFKTLIPTC